MASVNATGTLTFAANAVAAETVVVGGVTYTWAAAVGAANTVVVGGTAAISAQNLFDAVNATPAALGVTVGTGTVANPEVRASAVTATTVVLQSRVGGGVGNRIPTTETMTQGSFGGAVLSGGTGSLDTELRTILSTMQHSGEVDQALRDLAFDPATV
jgi:hypothetical protein